MAVRVKAYAGSLDEQYEYLDSTQTQREVTVDNMTFHFAPNQVINFLDEGVGAAVAAGAPAVGTVNIGEDPIPFGSSRF